MRLATSMSCSRSGSLLLCCTLAEAEASTRKAIANAAAPDVRGATLFNLGLILEQKQDTAGAVAVYSDSLTARPNSVVRARLTKLDSKAAAALDPYKPTAFTGPFADFAAYCKTLPADPPNDDDQSCQCGADPMQKDPARLAGAGPFQQVQIFSHSCGSHHTDAHDDDYKLAVKMADGWHVVPMESYAITGHCAGGEREYDWTETKQALFGTGASKVPSAMPPLVLRRHEVQTLDEFSGKPHTKTTADLQLDVKRGDGGKLTVSGKTTGVDQNEAGNLLGVHTVTFP